ncbi:MAG: UDP-N-acetylmuramoyl-L-alanyl-D-glutamate--2,6-diaminopimelate ligase [Actinomycetota bacterium]|nr:UDP-N-acetylmuramoyl-L-alanyl-D-glutamate--2,6-diaminopimelate ligase [Actinomycetota bacterium]
MFEASVIGADTTLTGVSASSDQARPGDLFAGVPGHHAHGARFAGQAVAAGAVAVLTDPAGRELVPPDVSTMTVADVRGSLAAVAAEIYGRPSSAMNVVGITGTSGKTTTTFLVRAGLEAAGRASGLIGTVATFIGHEQVKTRFTTPEAPELQAMLAVMLERGVRDVAMEVSSHALTMRRVDNIDFSVAAFTNLSQDHLDFHHDMLEYFQAKARLFDGDAWPVIVIDDEWGLRLVDLVGECTTVSATSGRGATWTAREVEQLPDGSTRFRAVGPGVEVVTGSAMPGRFNVANALLALAILAQLGVTPLNDAGAAVAAACVPGRMERLDLGQQFLAIVDYSHKPAAVESVLQALRPLTAKRLIVVLGCGGDRDRAKRPLMGEIAARGSDLLIVTDDNPRSEAPAAIRRAMLEGAGAVPVASRGEVREIGDRGDAIRAAVAAAAPGDTVLVAGKGHEMGQEIEGVVYPFDDREVLREAVRGVLQ